MITPNRILLAASLALCLLSPALATEFYSDTTFYSTIRVGTNAPVAGAAIRYTTATGSRYTNAAVTYTNVYRIDATNYAGRYPSGTNLVAIFRGGTNGTNAVALSWKPRGGAIGYVINRSFDAGTTWTNWLAIPVTTTNWTDAGTNAWTSTVFYTNAFAEIPAVPTFPWTGGSPDYAPLEARVDNLETTQAQHTAAISALQDGLWASNIALRVGTSGALFESVGAASTNVQLALDAMAVDVINAITWVSDLQIWQEQVNITNANQDARIALSVTGATYAAQSGPTVSGGVLSIGTNNLTGGAASYILTNNVYAPYSNLNVVAGTDVTIQTVVSNGYATITIGNARTAEVVNVTFTNLVNLASGVATTIGQSTGLRPGVWMFSGCARVDGITDGAREVWNTEFIASSGASVISAAVKIDGSSLVGNVSGRATLFWQAQTIRINSTTNIVQARVTNYTDSDSDINSGVQGGIGVWLGP